MRDEKDVALYNTMVGADGWCVNLDQTSKQCKIFDDRPWFCNIEKMATSNFNVAPDDVPQFANDCCQYHIDLVYGDDEDSEVMDRYLSTIGINFANLVDIDNMDIGPNDADADADENGTKQTNAQEEDDDEDDDPEILWADEEHDCESETCEIPAFDTDIDVEELAPIPDGSSAK